MNKANVMTRDLIKMLNALGEHDLARRIAVANVRTQTLAFRKAMLKRRVIKLHADIEQHEKMLSALDRDVAERLTPPSE